MVGRWLLVVGRWLLVVGCWSLVVGRWVVSWLLVIEYSFSKPQTTNYNHFKRL
jgi:hypothetical protein